METSTSTLINELTLGRDLAEQLKKQLNSHQPCESLIQKIVSSYDKAISMLNFEMGHPPSPVVSSELRRDFSSGCSRKREAFSDPEILADSNKKKKMQKWSQQVRASEGTEILDGFSWRKYGQKDILGANFPRAYYRCTNRVQGCLATKQVQRSDENISIFEITYKGKHTCIQSNVTNTMLKFEEEEGVVETRNPEFGIVEDVVEEMIETLMGSPKKEEVVSMVGCCSSELVSFPSFESFETEEILDYDMENICNWSEFDRICLNSNFPIDTYDFFFYDVIQNPGFGLS